MTAIARPLSPGELRLAGGMFGTAIDFARVRIHNRKAYFFQPAGTAITPNGEIYFPPQSYQADFSRTVGDAAWLIHELTHVWQHQRGMWVRVRGMLNRRYAYGDLSRAQKAFTSFGIEKQASIVADCFLLRHKARPTRGSGALADYERLIPFLPGSAG